MVAHRNAIDIRSGYKLLFIHLDISKSEITEVKIEDLPENWKSIEIYPVLQEMSSQWYQNKTSLILKVPSALIQWEYDYLINTAHPNFKTKISIFKTEEFVWDSRII